MQITNRVEESCNRNWLWELPGRLAVRSQSLLTEVPAAPQCSQQTTRPSIHRLAQPDRRLDNAPTKSRPIDSDKEEKAVPKQKRPPHCRSSSSIRLKNTCRKQIALLLSFNSRINANSPKFAQWKCVFIHGMPGSVTLSRRPMSMSWA